MSRDEINRCRGSDYTNGKEKKMSDLISREAVLEFEEYVGEPATWDKPYPKGDLYVKSEIIERIPSAEPERKTGHWIIDGEGMLHCSACAEIPVNRIRDAFKVVYDIHPLKMNYCPNCGVRMVGESE